MGLCLVTGATGYIGGRLAPRLLDAGNPVRCLVRSPARLRDAPWAGRAEIVSGDLLDPHAVRAALSGVDVAYYLVHSLGSASFEDTDRRAAATFAAAAKEAGVRRIVYLGGPEPEGHDVSAQLRSRANMCGLRPPPDGRPRRADLHLSHSIDSAAVPTYQHTKLLHRSGRNITRDLSPQLLRDQ